MGVSSNSRKETNKTFETAEKLFFSY